MDNLTESNVVEPPGTARDAREYLRIPRRPLLQVLRETADGKWRSIVLDSNDAAELLGLLEPPARLREVG